jgi:hypothetical protein
VEVCVCVLCMKSDVEGASACAYMSGGLVGMVGMA